MEVNADWLVNQDMAFKADEDGVLMKMKLELALQDLDISKEYNGGIDLNYSISGIRYGGASTSES